MIRCHRRGLLVGGLLLLLAACAPVRPDDLPAAGSGAALGPPTGAWNAQGRLQLRGGGSDWTGAVFVRRRGERLALALLADGGIPLAAITITTTGTTVEPEAMRERLSEMAAILRRAWWSPPPPVLTAVPPYREAVGGNQRLVYAGSPLSLRWFVLDHQATRCDDPRTLGDGILAHRLRGTGFTLTLAESEVYSGTDKPIRPR